MNRLFKIQIALQLILIPCVQADLTQAIGQQLRPTRPLFGGLLAEKQRQLAEIKEQRAKVIPRAKAENDARVQVRLDQLKVQLSQTQQQLEQNQDDEYLKQRLTLLNETYQTIKHIRLLFDSYLSLANDFAKVLMEYVEDPAFLNYQKERKLYDRLYYSFEDLQKLYEVTIEQQKYIEQLSEQKKSSVAELEIARRLLATAEEEYRKRKEELETISNAPQLIFKGRKYEPQQISDLLALEQQFYEERRQLDQLKVTVAKMQEEFISTKLLVAEGRLKVLTDYFRKVKHSVRITDADIDCAQEDFAKKRQVYFAKKEIQSKELEQVSELRKKREKELELASAKFGIITGNDLDDWSKELQQSADWYEHYVAVGLLNAEVLLLQKQQELVEAQMALEDEKLKTDVSVLRAKQIYQKILTNRPLTEDEVSNELKTDEASKIETRAILQRAKDRVLLVPDLLNSKKRAIENIRKLRQTITKERDLVFAGNEAQYTVLLESITAAETRIHEYIDILGRLTSVDSAISGNAANILRIIDFTTTELRSITFWYRPDYAISWHDVSSIGTDFTAFFFYVRSYVNRLSFSLLSDAVATWTSQPFMLLVLLIKLAFVVALLFFIFRVGKFLVDFLASRLDGVKGALRGFGLFLLAIVTFVVEHAVGLSLLIIIFCLLQFQPVVEPVWYIFFYLGSIPYLLYLTHAFLHYLTQFNIQYNYIFLAEDFQSRFFIVSSVFCYATIVIVLFREAFILVNYYGSALPIILLAINFIIFQVSLMLLISKEQIVYLISSKTPFWQWVKEQIEVYFYHIQILLVAIIIMSNPYVGYGRLVFYSFLGLIYTGLLVVILFKLYGFFKRVTSRVFFSTDDEVVRERFSNAKMWFGLFIITSFLVLLFAGIVLGAKIWGKPITYQDIYRWFTAPIAHSGSQGISIMSFFGIIAFVLIGLLLSQAFNRYVLDKIFDLLLVDAGIQHTISSITGYIFFMIALFLGFQRIGLGDLLGYAFGAFALSIGWILKEPISDFFSYFVILVQRPVKIGDYVRINEDVMGVVRKISVRSVVLRRRNSTTVIVPNSYVIGHVVTNWNYVRGFIAFDDIIITIDYREDPVLVREILLSVVESHPNILRTPRPLVRLEHFGEYGFVFLIRGFMSSSYTLDQWDIASDIRLVIGRTLKERNIKIGLPVRVLVSSTKESNDQMA